MKNTPDRRRRRVPRTRAGGLTFALLGLFSLALAFELLPARSFGQQAGPQPPPARRDEAEYKVSHSSTTGQWPSPLLHRFKVERSDKTRFYGLKASDISVELDGRMLDVKAGDLRQTENRRVSVLLLVDGSGSMHPDKLPAAKKALTAFVNQLDEQDVAAVYAFDDELREVVRATTNKDELKKGIEDFRLRWRGKHTDYTYLYQSVLKSLEVARENQIGHLVVLSDGMDYTRETEPAIYAEHDIGPYKREKEQSINQLANELRIPIFTIAVGDKGGQGNTYVDHESLSKISDATVDIEKSAVYIHLPELLDKAKEGEGKVSELLAGRLRGSLEEIRKLLNYDYVLTIPPPADIKQDNGEHFITIACAVCQGEPHTLAYTWPQGGKFTLKQVESRPLMHLYERPRGTASDRFGLAKIYLGLLSVLAVLGLAPAMTRRLSASGAAKQVRSAVVEVKDGSPFVGQECPNEGDSQSGEYLIKAGDVIVVCPNPECRTPHHMDCWHLTADHCWHRACQRHLPIPEHVLKRYGFAESDGSAPA